MKTLSVIDAFMLILCQLLINTKKRSLQFYNFKINIK